VALIQPRGKKTQGEKNLVLYLDGAILPCIESRYIQKLI